MNSNEHLLILLSEECNETGQRASKALRFGLKEVQAGQQLPNSERITYEFNDIVAIMEMLQDAGCISVVIDRDAIEKKKSSVKKWMEHSRQQGLLND